MTDAAANTAVITKMVRVMMLAPFLIILSTYLARHPQPEEAQAVNEIHKKERVVIPWFALWFVAVAAFHSFIALPKSLVSAAIKGDTFVLAMAMAALGVTTHVCAIRTAGIKPPMLAALLFAWLIVGGLGINAAISEVFS